MDDHELHEQLAAYRDETGTAEDRLLFHAREALIRKTKELDDLTDSLDQHFRHCSKCKKPNPVPPETFVCRSCKAREPLRAEIVESALEAIASRECFCEPDPRKGEGPCESCIARAALEVSDG
jgi:hypothetical protein